MNCNRLSIGALVLVLVASLAGVAMMVKGVAIADGWPVRFDPELRLPSAVSEIRIPGERL